MKQLLHIAKALSDAHRVRALCALQNGELCVCRIIELLDLAPSTVSKHMSVLKHAGLVDSRKQGRWIYYRLPKRTDSDSMFFEALDWVFGSLAKDQGTLGDAQRLTRILRQSPEALCKLRHRRKHN